MLRCGSRAREANRTGPVLPLEETQGGDDLVAAGWLVQVLCCQQSSSLLRTFRTCPG